MASDYLAGAQLIQGSGVATATATLTNKAGQRGYVYGYSVEVTAGTATVLRVQIQDAGSPVWTETFPNGAAGSGGGARTFHGFIPFTAINSALTIVATTTGATTTNVYGIVSYGP